MRGDFPVTLAVVAGAHGVAGEVRLKLFAEDLKAYARFNGGALTLTAIRYTPQGAVARFAEITNRNAAEGLRGVEITVLRSALPPLGDGEYYHCDLVGLPVVSTLGVDFGRVAAVENFGAGDVLEIERPDGARFMVPMTADAVPEWGERIVLDVAFVP